MAEATQSFGWRERFSLTDNVEAKKENDQNYLYKHCLWKYCCINAHMNEEEFRVHMRKLHNYCLVDKKDTYELHINRTKGLSLINEILSRVEAEHVKMHHLVHLFWCTLSCLHHFQMRIRMMSTRGPIAYFRRSSFAKALAVYRKLLVFVRQDYSTLSLDSIITFFNESNMWDIEFVCSEIISQLLVQSQSAEEGILKLLQLCQDNLESDVLESRKILQVLYSVLEKMKWKCISLAILVKFIKMFEISLSPGPDLLKYGPLKGGLEVCIKNMTQKLGNDELMMLIILMLKWIHSKDLQTEVLLHFGNITENAALLYKTKSIVDGLNERVIPNLLKLIASKSRIKCLLGNRVFQNLIDRKKNRKHFDSIKLFLQDSHYSIVPNVCTDEEKNYFRKHRDLMHHQLFASLTNHCTNRIILESVYATLSLILIEMPCGYTAAFGVCFAMAIQEFTLNKSGKIALEHSHHLHAFVMAIMTLVCYVHNAKVFYDYVNSIMLKRSEMAPFLNPPIKSHYNYAEHHILWNRPELFFEDWEARYGLWKCFKGKKIYAFTTAKKKLLLESGL